MKELLNVKQTAKILAISPRKLWEITNRKDIPHVRIDRCVRYREEDIDAYVTRKRVTGSSRVRGTAWLRASH